MILSYRLGYSCSLLLQQAIEEKTGKKLRVTCHPERVSRLHIRYGNSANVNCKDTLYNSAEFIRLCTNKLQFSKLLLDNGFYTPRYYHNLPTEENFPILVRTTLTGFSAQGIIPILNMDEYESISYVRRYYWTPFIFTNAEYRVQVLGGNIARLFKKTYREEVENELPIRNSYLDYHYSLRTDLSKFGQLVELVYNLDQVLVGKFYGLDIGWDHINKRYVIFEANSGYGININSAGILADYLIQERII